MSAIPVPVSSDWMTQRACIGVSPAVFFPEVGHTAALARSICAACPVTAECLAYALENREEYGIWGGTSPAERLGRQRAPRRPPVARCGTDAGYYRHLRQTFTEPCSLCREAHAMTQRLYKHRLAIVR